MWSVCLLLLLVWVGVSSERFVITAGKASLSSSTKWQTQLWTWQEVPCTAGILSAGQCLRGAAWRRTKQLLLAEQQNDESTCQGRGRRKSTGSGLSARGGWACQGKCPVMPGWIIPWGCVCGLILLPKPGLIHSEESKIARGRLCVKDHI